MGYNNKNYKQFNSLMYAQQRTHFKNISFSNLECSPQTKQHMNYNAPTPPNHSRLDPRSEQSRVTHAHYDSRQKHSIDEYSFEYGHKSRDSQSRNNYSVDRPYARGSSHDHIWQEGGASRENRNCSRVELERATVEKLSNIDKINQKIKRILNTLNEEQKKINYHNIKIGNRKMNKIGLANRIKTQGDDFQQLDEKSSNPTIESSYNQLSRDYPYPYPYNEKQKPIPKQEQIHKPYKYQISTKTQEQCYNQKTQYRWGVEIPLTEISNINVGNGLAEKKQQFQGNNSNSNSNYNNNYNYTLLKSTNVKSTDSLHLSRNLWNCEKENQGRGHRDRDREPRDNLENRRDRGQRQEREREERQQKQLRNLRELREKLSQQNSYSINRPVLAQRQRKYQPSCPKKENNNYSVSKGEYKMESSQFKYRPKNDYNDNQLLQTINSESLTDEMEKVESPTFNIVEDVKRDKERERAEKERVDRQRVQRERVQRVERERVERERVERERERERIERETEKLERTPTKSRMDRSMTKYDRSEKSCKLSNGKDLDLQIEKIQKKIEDCEQIKKSLNLEGSEVSRKSRSQLDKSLSKYKDRFSHSRTKQPTNFGTNKKPQTNTKGHYVGEFKVDNQQSMVIKEKEVESGKKQYQITRFEGEDEISLPKPFKMCTKKNTKRTGFNSDVKEIESAFMSEDRSIDKKQKESIKKLIQAICTQIDLDTNLRNLKKWFSRKPNPSKWAELSRELQKKKIPSSEEQNRKMFNLTDEEDNPFYTERDDEGSYNQLIQNFLQSEKHWMESIHGKFQVEEIKEHIEQVDIYGRGICIEDLVRFVNLESDKYYRNRDLALVFRRLAGSNDQITVDGMLAQLCHSG